MYIVDFFPYFSLSLDDVNLKVGDRLVTSKYSLSVVLAIKDSRFSVENRDLLNSLTRIKI